MQINDGFGGKEIVGRNIVPLEDSLVLRKSETHTLEELQGAIKQQGGNFKGVTDADIDKALNQTTGHKSVNLLLSKSPIGSGSEPSQADIESSGYRFVGTAMHLGAPMIYKSADGATITVYNGKGSAEAGEDKRKIIYQTDRYTQEMHYNDNGTLTEGEIRIKDNVAGFLEAQYIFMADENGKVNTVIR